MLDEEFTNINMMIKYYKFGFGRATDILNEQIRGNIITRKKAIKIAEKYDGRCSDQIIQNFCKYIGITDKFFFWKIVKKFTNKKLFYVNKKRPLRKFKSWNRLQMIKIIDIGFGNIASLHYSLLSINLNNKIINSPEEIIPEDKIILPGVGSIRNYMYGLRHKGFEKEDNRSF